MSSIAHTLMETLAPAPRSLLVTATPSNALDTGGHAWVRYCQRPLDATEIYAHYDYQDVEFKMADGKRSEYMHMFTIESDKPKFRRANLAGAVPSPWSARDDAS